MNIADLRREYGIGGLKRQDLTADPLTQFQSWFGQASAFQSGSRWRQIGIAIYKLWHAILGHAPVDVNAMVLGTVSQDGQPSARTVLLKGADTRGFIFFTNYDSRKGQELEKTPKASLVFYWPSFERQVCVAGTVMKLPREESEAYFKGRPKGSRLAAWASSQSDVVANRQALETKWQEMAARFPGQDVPLPPNWGGYVLAPVRIEFWQGRPNRLHDRFCYSKQGDGLWRIERLAP
ncbi:MAG: pyridoxamine 5'-phosphate oxidase [Verrucomicrobia bacterium]|jgi:pyridoxamine 5'-phosphate oxidase|nr:pyridoxamine 5'-phosphate oxidase [Verrucomicrobiota bacterium]